MLPAATTTLIRQIGGAARWKHDVLPQRTGRAFVMFGMNDVEQGNYEIVRWWPDEAGAAWRRRYSVGEAPVALRKKREK